MISRSLTFAFALDASSREATKVRVVFAFLIFFGSNSVESCILRMAIRRLRTFSGFESLRQALSRLVRIFLVLAYFAAKDVFKWAEPARCWLGICRFSVGGRDGFPGWVCFHLFEPVRTSWLGWRIPAPFSAGR